ncbi:DUF397 domain-containing protein [Actinokineospora sp. 24-640]
MGSARSGARWRKSTFSDHTTCVELAHTLNAMRDSKNPAGPVLSADASALVRAVRGGFLTP